MQAQPGAARHAQRPRMPHPAALRRRCASVRGPELIASLAASPHVRSEATRQPSLHSRAREAAMVLRCRAADDAFVFPLCFPTPAIPSLDRCPPLIWLPLLSPLLSGGPTSVHASWWLPLCSLVHLCPPTCHLSVPPPPPPPPFFPALSFFHARPSPSVFPLPTAHRAWTPCLCNPLWRPRERQNGSPQPTAAVLLLQPSILR